MCSKFGLIDDRDPLLPSVEINTIASSSLYVALSIASTDVMYCRVGDNAFVRQIPLNHFGQLLQHSLVVNAYFVIYVSASETGILFICVVQMYAAVRQLCSAVLVENAKNIVSWAHSADAIPPTERDPSGKQLVLEKLPFWRLVNNHVVENGALLPLKRFRHRSQTSY